MDGDANDASLISQEMRFIRAIPDPISEQFLASGIDVRSDGVIHHASYNGPLIDGIALGLLDDGPVDGLVQ